MIKVQIQQTAMKRGIENAHQLQKALDVSPTLAARLWKGEFTQIGLITLDRLCQLLKCQPDKLLRYEPDGE
ncbi:MAG TPA: helix-turn-helix transcriptional regulator [Blastocatellia bacterium]|nr:helix-turn-helix transcriptional regulator [Blastocatellia bacterium]